MNTQPNAQPKPLVIYLIAGEASGDLLGAHLMRAIRRQSAQPVLFYGVGGEKMQAEGLNSLFPYHELSMLGFIEVLPYAFNIFARVSLTAEDILQKKPDAVVTIDVPGFSFRVVEKCRKENMDSIFIHYVAPTVWAYKPQRAELFARLFDHLLVLLPFEPPYFEQAGLTCTWVGHAAVAETETGDGARFRSKYGIAPDAKLLMLLPGSRKGEVDRHMPVFARAVSMLATQYPDLAIAVAVPKNVMPFVAPYFENCPYRAVVMSAEQDKKDAIAAAGIAIAKSGTVALEVAKAGTPMIVAYRVNPISAWALRRISLTRYVNLINILLQREAIPELLQEHCTPAMIASASAHLLSHPADQQRQKEAAREALQTLVPEDGEAPSDKAARVILKLLH